jgi:hypothetical protein
MIGIIRRLIVAAGALALLGGATACSALLGPTPDEIVDKGIETRVAELIEVLGVSDAQPLDVSQSVSINGEYLNNDAGFGTYYVLFGDGCWATVVFGRINEESGQLEAGWADQMPNFEAEDGYGQQPIDNADDMAAFAAASCTDSAVTPDSP